MKKILSQYKIIHALPRTADDLQNLIDLVEITEEEVSGFFESDFPLYETKQYLSPSG